MAKSRKDPRGRMLRKGESWREQDQRYTYTYTDPLGRRKWVYASDLVVLPEKEKKLMGHRNIETTMDIYAEATEERKQESFEGLALKLDNLF